MTADSSKPGDDIRLADLEALPPTIDIETAAGILGIGRTLAYQLAKADDFPCRVLRLGRCYRVPAAELIRLLGTPPDDAESRP
jgi:predicted DNA-binding transcriptional regulator AlpA